MKKLEKRELIFKDSEIIRMIYHHGALGEVCKINNVLFKVRNNEAKDPILYEKFFYPNHTPNRQDLKELGF